MKNENWIFLFYTYVSTRLADLMLRLSLIVMALATSLACEKHDYSFTIMSDSQEFKQDATFVPRKVDILWVIDNSGSMQTSQDELTSKFQNFINNFQTLNFDFHMAITTTDAWRGFYLHNNSYFSFKDGLGSNHSNVFVMDKETNNLPNVFLINASQGISGSGDERAFSSFKYVLECSNTDCPNNANFRRPDAFLAIIILSDEDDMSATTSSFINNNYNDARLVPVDNYITFLNSYAGQGNYNVNAISILDTACFDELNAHFNGPRIGTRYIEIATKTGGTTNSLCSDFSQSLKNISDTIISGVSKYTFTREPIPESILVLVNGEKLPANDPVNGWTYDPATLTLQFGTHSIPVVGSDVKILYDPKAPKN